MYIHIGFPLRVSQTKAGLNDNALSSQNHYFVVQGTHIHTTYIMTTVRAVEILSVRAVEILSVNARHKTIIWESGNRHGITPKQQKSTERSLSINCSTYHGPQQLITQDSQYSDPIRSSDVCTSLFQREGTEEHRSKNTSLQLDKDEPGQRWPPSPPQLL